MDCFSLIPSICGFAPEDTGTRAGRVLGSLSQVAMPCCRVAGAQLLGASIHSHCRGQSGRAEEPDREEGGPKCRCLPESSAVTVLQRKEKKKKVGGGSRVDMASQAKALATEPDSA